MSNFRDSYSLAQRQNEASRITQKYPERIPVIVEMGPNTRNNIPNLDKKKYLVPCDLTVGQFVYVIRKRLELEPEKAIFLFVGTVLPPTGLMMSSVYESYKNEDGFLYFTVCGENTFG
jgi:GABA(A) receptor-associated protein